MRYIGCHSDCKHFKGTSLRCSCSVTSLFHADSPSHTYSDYTDKCNVHCPVTDQPCSQANSLETRGVGLGTLTSEHVNFRCLKTVGTHQTTEQNHKTVCALFHVTNVPRAYMTTTGNAGGDCVSNDERQLCTLVRSSMDVKKIFININCQRHCKLWYDHMTAVLQGHVSNRKHEQ